MAKHTVTQRLTFAEDLQPDQLTDNAALAWNLLAIRCYGEAATDKQLGRIDGVELLSITIDHASARVAVLTILCAESSLQKRYRIVSQFVGILSQLLSGVGSTSDELQFACKEDVETIMRWNRDAPPVVLDTIVSQISRNAEDNPTATAVQGPDCTLSYAELVRASWCFARRLYDHGVRPQKAVLFCVAKEARSIVAIAAILRLGAIAIPLDPSHPASRNMAIAEVSEAVIVLVAPQYLEKMGRDLPGVTALAVPECGTLLADTTLRSDHSNGNGNGNSNDNLHMQWPSCTDLAFVLFTSGSTGTPKGVLLDHCAICTSAATHGAVQRVGPSTRALQFSAFTFDVSVYDVWTTLMRGGCVVLVAETECLNNLAGVINAHRINFAAITPSLISTMSPNGIRGCLQTMSIVGEGPTQDIVDVWAPHVQLVNAYGSAEASTCAPAIMLPGTKASWIGRAVGACAWVVDAEDHRKLAPVGAIGELMIEGSIMARGYLGRDKETADHFISSPPAWCPRKNARMYLTGDLVRYCCDGDSTSNEPDGSMIYVGRKNRLLKLHGRRIDPAEVEAHVRRHLGTSSLAAVEVIGGPHPRLVTFISRDNSASETNAGQMPGILLPITGESRNKFRNLRQHLWESLPVYMVPSAYVPLASMPMLASQKIDRSALMRIGNSLQQNQLRDYLLEDKYSDSTQILDPGQLVLAALWETVMAVPATSIHPRDNFFGIGGDSVTAIRLVSEARKSRLLLSVESIFLHPCLEEMSKLVQPLDPEASIGTAASLDGSRQAHKADRCSRDDESLRLLAAAACFCQVESVLEVYPATPFQEAMIALSAQRPGSYVRRLVFELPDAVDLDRFVQAWRVAHGLYPILRTRIFQTAEGRSFSAVLNEPFTVVSLEEGSEHGVGLSVEPGTPLIKYFLERDARTFVWVAHHSTYDAWSDTIILKTVANAYLDSLDPESVSVPSYREFTEYCADLAVDVEAVSFWRDRLCEAGPGPGPSQYPRTSPGVVSYPDETLHYTMAFPAVNSGSAAGSRKITMANIIKAAWAIVLHLYAGSNDIIYGCITTGRTAPIADVERMAGPTMATIPMRLQLDPEQTLSSFLQSVQMEAGRIMSYEQIGIQNIRKACNDVNAGNFNSMLVIHPEDSDPLVDFSDLLGLKSIRNDSESGPGFHTDPITINCYLQGDHADLRVSYDSKATSTFVMNRIVEVFEHTVAQLLLSLASSPQTTGPDSSQPTLKTMACIPESHKRTIWGWNQNLPSAELTTLPQAIGKQARNRPNSIALVGPDRNYTYSDLDSTSTRLSLYLRQKYLQQATCRPILGLFLEKSSLAVVAMVAVMKLGGTFVSLSHPSAETGTYPKDRVATITGTTSPSLVLCRQGDLDLCTGLLGVDPDMLVGIDALLDQGQSSIPMLHMDLDQLSEIIVDPEDIAYIMTTSGSTGIPKCCQISHRAICTSIKAQADAIGMGPWIRAYQFSAYTFDTSIADIFTPLGSGGSVLIPSESDRLNDVAGSMNRLHANFAYLTPTVIDLLEPEQVPELKILAPMGEPIHDSIIAKWAAKVRLINAYGPAECAVICTVSEIAPNPVHLNSIGRAIGSAAWITDPDNPDMLVPIGCAGELCIEGPIVASGYINEAEKTAAAFLRCPRWLNQYRVAGQRSMPSHEKVAMVYRTGDLVVYNDDGSIDCLGRKDSQVKISGQRVELGEIEHHLSIEAAECAVAVGFVRRKNGSSKVVAFLGPASGDTVPTAAPPGKQPISLFLPVDTPGFVTRAKGISERLVGILPAYMIPSAYIPLSYMPMAKPSMKKDRRTLQDAAKALSEEKFLEYVAMRADSTSRETESSLIEQEKSLLKMWELALGKNLDGIARNESFLRVGGDSVSAMKLSRVARAQGHTALDVRVIIMNPELNNMAKFMAETVRLQPDVTGFNIKPFALLPPDLVAGIRSQASEQCGVVSVEAIEDIYPCTALQEAMFTATLKNQDAYVGRNIFKCTRSLDIDCSLAAWERVVAAVAILRTRIVNDSNSGVLYQAVLAHTGDFFKVARCTMSLANWVARDSTVQRSFGAPLASYALVEEPETGDIFFVWVLHHCLYDAQSYKMIVEMVNEAYHGHQVTTQVSPFPNFVDLVSRADQNEQAASFWRRELEDATATKLRAPPKKQQDTTPLFSQATYSLKLLEMEQALPGILISTLLNASLALALSRYTDSPDVTFGTVLSGRNVNLDNMDKVIGPTITTVPVRIRWSADETVLTYLQRIQNEAAAVIPFQHYGLQNINKASKANACDFDVILVVQKAGELDLAELDGYEAVTIAAVTNFHTHPLNIEFVVEQGQIRAVVQYDTKKLSGQELELLMWQLDSVLQQLCSTTGSHRGKATTISEINLLSDQEREKIMGLNTSRPVYAAETSVSDLFRNMAIQQPNAVAVVGHDGSFTYSELDQFSDRLVYRLQRSGILDCQQEKQRHVGLMFEKSSWYIVAMMALIKAPWTSFVPLDPSWPNARVKDIAERLGMVSMLVSERQSGRIPLLDIESLLIEVVSAGGFGNDATQYNGPVPMSPNLNGVSYVVSTSGSTGVPKLVVIEEAALATSLLARGLVMGFSPSTRTLQFASHGFDASLDEILLPLTHGGSIAILPDSEVRNDVAGVIRMWNANFAFLTPTMAQIFSPADVSGSLETLVLMGEQMTEEVMATWRNAVTLFNGYGPSECAVAATIQEHSGDDEKTGLEPNNVGFPRGCHVWIVGAEDHAQLVPFGQVGEICIEGPILGRGYYGDDATTRNSFIDKAGFIDTEARLYKTGDLGRLQLDGSVTILGRKDTQAKLHGQRLELGDIESRIKSAIGYSNHVGVVVEVVDGSLVAFICLEDDQNTSRVSASADAVSEQSAKSEIAAHLLEPSEAFLSLTKRLENCLREQLPNYMVPTLYVHTSRIPTNSSSKTDRKALRGLITSLSQHQLLPFLGPQSISIQGPRNSVESIMRTIWAKVLGLDEESISVTHDWFKIGGHSVNAIHLASLARAAGLSLTVRAVFLHSSLEDMAAISTPVAVTTLAESDETHQQSQLGVDDAGVPEPFSLLRVAVGLRNVSDAKVEAALQCRLEVDQIEDMMPCTPLQEALFSLSSHTPGAYVNTHAYRVTSDVNIDQLKAACETVVSVNPILRARICSLDQGQFLTMVRKESAFFWDEQTTDCTLAEFIKTVQTSAGTAPSGPSSGDLLSRFYVVRKTSTGERFFLWVVHHALYDGHSMPLLLKQLQAVYNGDVLSEPTTSFSKYVAWSQAKVEDVKSASGEGRSFWNSYLRGPIVSRMSLFDQARASSAGTSPNQTLRRILRMPKMLQKGLDGFNGITQATVLRAAWALILAIYSNHPDVCWGMTLSGRDAELDGLSDIIGPTIATVPVRITILPPGPGKAETINRFLRRTQREAAQMTGLEHAGTQNIANVSKDARAACVFNTRQVITIQASPSSDERLVGMNPVGDQDMDTERVNQMDCGLVMECTVSDTYDLHLDLAFDDSMAGASEMESLLDCFELILRQLSENGSMLVEDLVFVDTERTSDYTRRFSECRLVTVDRTNQTSVSFISDAKNVLIVSSRDGRRQPVPLGATGELCVSGSFESHNDYKRLDQTHAIPSATEAYFSTGYLARIDGENNLVILGRKDDQRVVQGRILFTREYENDTLSHPEDTETLPEAQRLLTDKEHLLAEIWAQVLGISQDKLAPSSSFLGLGGDSIISMRLVARLQKRGMQLKVSDVLGRSSNLSSMALLMQPVQIQHHVSAAGDNALKDVGLVPMSPLQRLFFQLSPEGCSHFNQSSLLILPSSLDLAGLQACFTHLVSLHASLRSRFVQDPHDGSWKQETMSTLPPGSGISKVSSFKGGYELEEGIAEVQKSLDIRAGPIFAYRVFEDVSGKRLLLMVAHHLVIDLVSWGVVVEDLRSLLKDQSPMPRNSLSWRSWCLAQEKLLSQTVQVRSGAGRLTTPCCISPEVLSFWGMTGKPNIFADVASHSAVLDESLTSMFLGSANRAFRTEPVEILIAALTKGFIDTLGDRNDMTLFVEGHGRDLYPNVDVSQTVGWFTTLSPISISGGFAPGIPLAEYLRRCKDDHRLNSRNSATEMARNLVSLEDPWRFQLPVETLVNYTGASAAGIVSSADTDEDLILFASEHRLDPISDVSPDMPRMALFDVFAGVEDGKLCLSIQYNQLMQKRDLIKDWLQAWVATLKSGLPRLVTMNDSLTLSDVPLLSSSLGYQYHDLDQLERIELLQSRGISAGEVEDAYPCSAVQQGILMGQLKEPGAYVVQFAFDVRASSTVHVSALESAWHMVVERHDSLRTIFVDMPETGESEAPTFTQVVLKRPSVEINHCSLSDVDFNSRKGGDLITHSPSISEKGLPHSLTIWSSSSGQILVVLNISHAIIDGHSIDVMLRDWKAAYRSIGSLAPGPSYRNYIDLHLKCKKDSALYWKAHLEGAEPCIFPVLDGSGSETTDNPKRTLEQLKAALPFSPVLHEFCRRHGFTIANVACLGWALVLRLYTGSEAPVFGRLHSGRDAMVENIEDAVGVYISMVVSRVALQSSDGERGVGALSALHALHRVHQDFVQGLEHTHCSLADIQRDLAVTSLFNTGISLQREVSSEPTGGSGPGGVEFEPIHMVDPTEYDVAISISVGESVEISLAYWVERVPKFQAHDVLHIYIKALEAITSAPTQSLDDILDLLAIESQARIAGSPETPAVSSVSIAELVACQVQSTPNAPAVHGWDGVLTYDQLTRHSRRLSSHLESRGIGPGTLVPICTEKSIWNVIAVLGVLGTGAGFVPIEPALPKAAKKHIFQSVSAGFAIVTSNQAANIHEFFVDETVLLPDALLDGDEDADAQTQEPQLAVDLRSTAYVIFTSGSTGTPKGVAVSHGALSSSCANRWQHMGFGPDRRVLQFASSAFDVAVDEILLTLISGGCVCIPSDTARREDLAGAISSLRVNTAMLTPSVAQLIQSPGGATLSTLDHLVLGGEKITERDINAWLGRVRRLDIVYGPTECAIASTLYPFVKGPGAAGSLGRPVGCAVWIVDPEDVDRLLPPGCCGEMLIEGPILASEYRGDAEKTAKSFISAPRWARSASSSEKGYPNPEPRRFFRTGDLVSQDGNGILRFSGRKDDQIKLRGLRIEPQAIEQHIVKNWPGDRRCQAVVEIVSREDGTTVLIAFVCSAQTAVKPSPKDASPLADSVSEAFRTNVEYTREALLAELPAYMVPAIFIPLNLVPFSNSGKTDRRRLNECAQKLTMAEMARFVTLRTPDESAGGHDVRPATAEEDALKLFWSGVLGVPSDKLGTNANFFQAGGDSMTALRLSATARAAGYEISVAAIFRRPVLSDMAKLLLVKTSLTERLPVVPPAVAERDFEKLLSDPRYEDVFEATEFQSWCVNCSLADARAYMTYFALDLDGVLDISRLRKALETLIAGFPVLRTVFLVRKGTVVQAILANSTTNLDLQEIISPPKANIDTLCANFSTQDQEHSPFRVGELITKFVLFRQPQSGSPARNCLVMRLSHAQYDGFSFPGLLDGLRQAYLGKEVTNPESFKGFVQASRQSAAAAQHYWQLLLSGARPTPVHAVPDSKPAITTARFPDRLSTHHISLPAAHQRAKGTTTAVIVRASWAMVLAQLSATSDVLFGQVASGREHSQISQLAAGPTMNYVPVRVQFQPRWTAADVLGAVGRQFAESLPYHCGPVFPSRGRASGGLDDDDMTIRRAVFSTVLQYQSGEIVEGVSSDAGTGGAEVTIRAARTPVQGAFLGCADVFVFVEPTSSSTGEAGSEDGVAVTLSYCSAYIPDSLIKQMAAELGRAMQLLSFDTNSRIQLPDFCYSEPVIPYAR